MSTKIAKALLSTAAAAVITLLAAQPAIADSGLASVTNDGTRTIKVCKSATSSTTCGPTVGTLTKGQNSQSKYGWPDTDLVWANGGCELQTWGWTATTGNAWQPFASGGSSGRWIKLPGNPVGTRTYSFRLVC